MLAGAMPAEFDLIQRYFRRAQAAHGEAAQAGGDNGVVLGIGDDCALFSPTPGMQLAVSTDALIEGVHFPADTPSADVGYKVLAVNLSDLAAMGAQPRGCLLALALPSPDEVWVAAFARGFFELADAMQCPLMGGDTTAMPVHAPRTLTVTVFGEVPAGEALRRDGARAGDFICISGRTGEAAHGLALWQAGIRDRENAAVMRLLRPSPRIGLGVALRGVASSAIDVSDGLLADLQHVLDESSRAHGTALGAQLQLAALPVAPVLAAVADLRALMLAGGDDYELCFTFPPAALLNVRVAAESAGVPVTVIGQVTNDGAVRCMDADGREWQPPSRGFEHFVSR